MLFSFGRYVSELSSAASGMPQLFTFAAELDCWFAVVVYCSSGLLEA